MSKFKKGDRVNVVSSAVTPCRGAATVDELEGKYIHVVFEGQVGTQMLTERCDVRPLTLGTNPHPLAGDPIEMQTFGPLPEDPTTNTTPGAVNSIDATLAERGSRYGEFCEHARITQNIKRAMSASPNWAELSDDKKEALEMVAHKVGRILNGDPEYHDSWHDIIGYTKLVADKLEK